jgi:hypothetical protein
MNRLKNCTLHGLKKTIKMCFCLFLGLFGVFSPSAHAQQSPFLVFQDASSELYGFKDAKDTVRIPARYTYYMYDTFYTWQLNFVVSDTGWVAINAKGEHLFRPFLFENVPEGGPLDGMYRVEHRGKIGYANAEGKIVIPPQYPCGYGFANGKANVALECQTLHEGEHYRWESNDWFYIDKYNRRVE